MRGLSEVRITTSLKLPAASPIGARFERSRSPPQPNTVMIFPFTTLRAVRNTFNSASSLCA